MGYDDYDLDESILDAMMQDAALLDLKRAAPDREELIAILAERDNFGAEETLDIEEPEDEQFIPVQIDIDEDGLTAYITLHKVKGCEEELTEDLLREAVSAEKITMGIKQTVILRLAGNPIYGRPFVVAAGKEPQEGTAPEIRYYFDPEKKLMPTEVEDGRIDFTELGFVQNVQEGDLLCEMIPGEPGIDGYTVLGEVLHPAIKQGERIRAGMNTKLSPDKNQLLAACDGEVTVKNGDVVVEKVLHVDNVDLSTGNIRYIGTVYVRDRICEGFSLKATGNVIVGEVIEGALVSAGGDIVVGKGMKGKKCGKVSAKGDIHAYFIEEMEVESEKNIYADTIVNSEIRCDGKVSLNMRRGRLIGGSCQARELDAVEIGNDANIATEVRIMGIEDLTNERMRLEHGMTELERNIKKLQVLLKVKADHTKLPELQNTMIQTVYKKNESANKIKLLDEKIQYLKKTFAYTVKVKEVMHPNVTVWINNSTYRNMRMVQACMFFLKEEEIVRRPYHY